MLLFLGGGIKSGPGYLYVDSPLTGSGHRDVCSQIHLYVKI